MIFVNCGLKKALLCTKMHEKVHFLVSGRRPEKQKNGLVKPFLPIDDLSKR